MFVQWSTSFLLGAKASSCLRWCSESTVSSHAKMASRILSKGSFRWPSRMAGEGSGCCKWCLLIYYPCSQALAGGALPLRAWEWGSPQEPGSEAPHKSLGVKLPVRAWEWGSLWEPGSEAPLREPGSEAHVGRALHARKGYSDSIIRLGAWLEGQWVQAKASFLVVFPCVLYRVARMRLYGHRLLAGNTASLAVICNSPTHTCSPSVHCWLLTDVVRLLWIQNAGVLALLGFASWPWGRDVQLISAGI